MSTGRLAFTGGTLAFVPLIVVASLIPAMSLISILAPNALGVEPALATQTSLTVPTLALSSGMIFSMVPGDDCVYSSPTQNWQRIIQRAMMSNDFIGWTAPEGCGPGCDYSIEYNAPALRCADLTSAQIWDPETSTTPPAQAQAILNDQQAPSLTGIFNASSNVGPAVPDPPATNSTSPYTYTFTLAYQPLVDAAASHNSTGSICTFHDATYRASVSFANNTQLVKTEVLAYLDALNNSYILPLGCTTYGFDIEPPAGLAHAVNYHAICEIFAGFLNGNIIAATINNVGTLDISTSIGLTNLFAINQTTGHWGFTPAVANISQSLSDLFTNVTLAMFSQSTATANVEASVLSSGVVWVYNMRRLWTIYGVGIAVTIACSIFGILCLFANGSPSGKDFSQLLAATRNSDLDTVVLQQERRATMSKAAQAQEDELRLRYGWLEDPSTGGRMAFGMVGTLEAVEPVSTLSVSHGLLPSSRLVR